MIDIPTIGSSFSWVSPPLSISFLPRFAFSFSRFRGGRDMEWDSTFVVLGDTILFSTCSLPKLLDRVVFFSFFRFCRPASFSPFTKRIDRWNLLFSSTRLCFSVSELFFWNTKNNNNDYYHTISNREVNHPTSWWLIRITMNTYICRACGCVRIGDICLIYMELSLRLFF